MSDCPCGTGSPFADCCEPYISGARPAPTAEALMRSRYSAFAKHDVKYIVKTNDPDRDDEIDEAAILKWMVTSQWQGLEVSSTEAGGEDDDAGIVEFVASYRVGDERRKHHEVALFRKVEERWVYVEGTTGGGTIQRESPRVGRNAPCPCGSGKKYKRCCGKPGAN